MLGVGAIETPLVRVFRKYGTWSCFVFVLVFCFFQNPNSSPFFLGFFTFFVPTLLRHIILSRSSSQLTTLANLRLTCHAMAAAAAAAAASDGGEPQPQPQVSKEVDDDNRYPSLCEKTTCCRCTCRHVDVIDCCVLAADHVQPFERAFERHCCR